MKLVFIHGWGLDAHLWDGILALLPDAESEIIERGFFGAAERTFTYDEPAILIGHSLGLIHGFNLTQNWAGWIAINSFPRFVATDSLSGCVPPAALRDMRQRLNRDPQKTLGDFHKMIGAIGPNGMPDIDKLRVGLDELRDGDIAALSASKPGLVLASRHDPLAPEPTSATLIQNDKQQIIWHEGASHVLPQSEPAWCAQHITAFVKHHAR
jgi:pimeloyl-[acyl-carrier protein] methyl ester esterase